MDLRCRYTILKKKKADDFVCFFDLCFTCFNLCYASLFAKNGQISSLLILQPMNTNKGKIPIPKRINNPPQTLVVDRNHASPIPSGVIEIPINMKTRPKISFFLFISFLFFFVSLLVKFHFFNHFRNSYLARRFLPALFICFN